MADGLGSEGDGQWVPSCWGPVTSEVVQDPFQGQFPHVFIHDPDVGSEVIFNKFVGDTEVGEVIDPIRAVQGDLNTLQS